MGQTLSVFRSELKFQINPAMALKLDDEFKRFMQPDAYSSQGSYRVKSLYFDTINNMDYFDKENGVFTKKKIRLRTYDETGDVFKFECKEKVGDLQHKTSLFMDRREAEALMNADYSFLLLRDEADAVRLYSMLQLGLYRPVVMIEYNRKAYTYPEYNTRITFDSEVKYSEINLDIFDPDINYDYALLDNLILEVKYNKTLIKYIKKLLAHRNLNYVSYSKYEWCRTLLH